MLYSPLTYSHKLLESRLKEGDLVIDATVGNGNDTLFLNKLVKAAGKVIGLDIQAEAIDRTRERIKNEGVYESVELHQTGHEQLGTLNINPESVAAVMFNLGYLPRGDKSVITLEHTTLIALKTSLTLLKTGGLITIMVYYGHPGGEEEKNGVIDFVRSLSQKEYQVLQYGFINQKNAPPFLLVIEKL
ncbi:SAM-dependent methyltransferase, MraW methylase family [Alkalibacterium sp. AK22]|uniref:class I SAM-dependent methyltransferase n=1 Tax=Alkalibacterium sp. AK22 TaxID=1229520 RepID=UPI000448AB7A|nr:class I SAM-dependent methyltransferase [Alkalibacterium sp. AK22]EXJ22749.1 SAM-dependent methyltransferase, MraW methylase family [Alkalibacterium sp. AK22]